MNVDLELNSTCKGCLSNDRNLSPIVDVEQKLYFLQLFDPLVSFCIFIINNYNF